MMDGYGARESETCENEKTPQ